MLSVNLGIIFGAYVGIWLSERYDKKKSLNKLTIKLFPKTSRSSSKKRARNPKNVQPTQFEYLSEKKLVNKTEHHFKMCSANLGLTFLSYLYPPLTLFSVSLITYSSIPVIREAQQTLLKERQIKNAFLSSIVIFVGLILGRNYVGALQVWVYHLGDKMLNKTQNTSATLLTNVFKQQPSKVWILKDNVEIEIPLESLQIEDIVVVKTGEVVPIDGTILDGMAMIDQHVLTGEAVPVEKGLGDQVFAATLLISGKIQIKVERTGVETTVSKLSEILNHTAEFQTNLQLQGEKWSDRVALPLVGGSFFSSFFLGISSATAILFSAPTNSVRIFTSLQTLNHLSLNLNKGILVKDGRALEEILKVDTILFDKTGTLTNQQPTVGQIIPCDDLSETEILTYAASAECRLAHPIAHAIFDEAKKRQLNLLKPEDAYYQVGYGVTVKLENFTIQVGSIGFMKIEGITLPPQIEAAITDSKEEGYTLIMVAINHRLKGAIEIQPHIRPEVKNIIKGLRQRGIQQIAIVSGDHKQPTAKLAQELEVDDYFAEILPEDKAALVERLQKEGHRVCFVGDGINDTIAMKKANVSVSLSGAASITTDIAQVVLMDGTLNHLPDIIDISTQLHNHLQQSLWYCLIYGILNTVATVSLRLGLTETAIIFSLFFSSGVTHAMLPLRQLKKPIKTEQ
jgi:Cu2+-exporting ATPase